MSDDPVFLALGSNLGDREENIRIAIRKLGKEDIFVPLAMSSLYETEAKYVIDQPDFLNMVLKGRTGLSPEQLLGACKGIEREMGRNFQEIRNGPRLIDIDILFYGAEIMDTETLKIPHPLLKERRFVLEPLAEIAGTFIHPHLQCSIDTLMKICQDSAGVTKIKSTHSWISD
ncbi:MAG: 2-amino-4-hydroxy-6-hydroxymethyldihydropteridine diphosphokinase [Fidelibacterota bacterium]